MVQELKVKIDQHSVNSSNIKSIGHTTEGNVLEVVFWTGAIYRYWPITQEAFNEMKSSASVGKYFSDNIRTNERITTKQIKSK